MKKFFIYSIYLFVSLFVHLHSQNFTEKVDSLYHNVSLAKTDIEKIGAYDALSDYYSYFGDIAKQKDSVWLYSEKILSLSRKIDYPDGEYIGHFNMARYFYLQEDYEKSLNKYNVAMKIAEDNNNISNRLDALRSIANCYFAQTKYYDAYLLYKKGYDLSIKEKKGKGIFTNILNISYIYGELGIKDKGIEYANFALEVLDTITTMSGEDISYYRYDVNSNLGVHYLKADSLEEAKTPFKIAEDYIESKNNGYDKSYLYANIAELYLKLYKKKSSLIYLDSTLFYARKAEKNAKLANFQFSLTKAYEYLANGHYNLGNLDSSKIYNQKLYEQLSSKEFDRTTKTHKLFYKIYKDEGQLKQATFYADMFFKDNDSLVQAGKEHLITDSQLLFQINNTEYKKAQELKQLNEKQQRQLLYIVIGTLLSLLVLFFYFRNKQRFNQQELKRIKAENDIIKRDAVIEIDENERKHVAQVLHDELNGDLSVLKYSMSSIESTTEESKIHLKIEECIDIVDTSIEKIRALSHNLKSPISFKYTLVEAIENLCSSINEKYNLIDINFSFFGTQKEFKKNVQNSIYRIVNELVTNAVKHSECNSVIVQLNYLQDILEITVEDDGKGFEVKENYISGLKNIKLRMELLEAKLNVISDTNGTSFNLLFNESLLQPN